jgi:hypothetical protein
MNRLPLEPIPIDVAFRRLKAAGWTIGEVATDDGADYRQHSDRCCSEIGVGLAGGPGDYVARRRIIDQPRRKFAISCRFSVAATRFALIMIIV